MQAFLLGTATGLLWGIGDFLVRGVSARLGTAGALFYSHLIFAGVIAVSAVLLGPGNATPDADAWLLGLAGAVLNLAMIASVYRALHHGPLPVVAPIIASYAAVTTLLALATGTDTLRTGPALCLGVVFVGVLLAAIEPSHGDKRGSRAGIGWAIASSIFSGALSWVQGVAIVPALGEVRALLLNVALVLVVSGVFVLRSRPPVAKPIDGRVVALGACMAAGFLAFFFGLGTGEVVIVSVLSSMCGAVTALLGVVVEKQPATRLQWCGGGLILAGVIALKML